MDRVNPPPPKKKAREKIGHLLRTTQIIIAGKQSIKRDELTGHCIMCAGGLRRGSAATRLLGLRVRIPPGHGCLSLVSVVCC
jgi:hypothetical protein